MSPRFLLRRRRLLTVALCSIGAAAWAGGPRLFAATVQAAARELDVMTFNLRYAHTSPPDLWPDRLPVVVELIKRQRPDIIGTQEGLYHQLIDMEARLPDYEWIGTGRDGDSRGEFNAVFYRRERLEPLAFENYALSDTPAIPGSSTWGNNITRMVTSVRFRDRLNGGELLFVNTHLDHEVQRARELSAALILKRLPTKLPGMPVILVGDFNVRARSNTVYDLLTREGGFVDTWVAAGHADTLGTHHSFKGAAYARGTNRIDWILSRGPVAPLSTEIVTYAHGTQYPSDHFPVVARVRLSRRFLHLLPDRIRGHRDAYLAHDISNAMIALTGRYEIEREIGARGNGHGVPRARRAARPPRRPQGLKPGPRRRSRCRAIPRGNHGHGKPAASESAAAVRLGEADGLLFYVMPFVEGESLRAQARSRKAAADRRGGADRDARWRALSITRTAHGVIHRDLKPENILLHDGQPLVADFGIALAVSNAGGERITQTGLLARHAAIHVPRAGHGRPRRSTRRSDIYSLGAVTYEMLAGEPPHMGGTAQTIIAKILTETAPSRSRAGDQRCRSMS